MEIQNHLLLKIYNPITHKELIVYENKVVYDDNNIKKTFKISKKAISQIKSIIKRDIYMLKALEYSKNRKGLVVKIFNSNDQNKYLKVVGWAYEREILSIIFNKDNIITSITC